MAKHKKAPRNLWQPLLVPVGTKLADAEREIILRTLEAYGNNKQEAAKVLGLSRRSLYNKLSLYGKQ